MGTISERAHQAKLPIHKNKRPKEFSALKSQQQRKAFTNVQRCQGPPQVGSQICQCHPCDSGFRAMKVYE